MILFSSLTQRRNEMLEKEKKKVQKLQQTQTFKLQHF